MSFLKLFVERLSRIGKRAETQIENKLRVSIVIWLGILCLGTSILFNQFGSLHHELFQYIPYHLSGEPVLHIIFNGNVLEHPPSYQARELSYLVDHFDVLAMAKSVQYQFPLFISMSHILFSLLIGTILWRFFTRDLNLDKITSTLLALLLWTAPYIYIHAIFRSAKIGAALFGLLLFIKIFRLFKKHLQNPSPSPTWPTIPDILSIFFLGLLASLFDRQGLFLLGMSIPVILLISCLLGRIRLSFAAVPIVAAVIVHLLYFYLIAPALAFKFHQQNPSFEYSSFSIGSIFTEGMKYLFDSLGILTDTIKHSIGNPPTFLLIALLLLLIVVLRYCDKKLPSECYANVTARRLGILLPCITLVFLFTWGMYWLMEIKHPPISWPEVRIAYYWIPTGVGIFVVIGIVLHAIGKYSTPFTKHLTQGVLVIMLIGNIISLPSYRQCQLEGHLKNEIAFSVFMREALMRSYDITYTPPVIIQKNPAYVALKQYALEKSGASLIIQKK